MSVERQESCASLPFTREEYAEWESRLVAAKARAKREERIRRDRQRKEERMRRTNYNRQSSYRLPL